MGRLAVEAVRLEQRAILSRALLEPAGKAGLIDEVDRAGSLAAVGEEEGGEVVIAGALGGHPPGRNRECDSVLLGTAS